MYRETYRVTQWHQILTPDSHKYEVVINKNKSTQVTNRAWYLSLLLCIYVESGSGISPQSQLTEKRQELREKRKDLKDKKLLSTKRRGVSLVRKEDNWNEGKVSFLSQQLCVTYSDFSSSSLILEITGHIRKDLVGSTTQHVHADLQGMQHYP